MTGGFQQPRALIKISLSGVSYKTSVWSAHWYAEIPQLLPSFLSPIIRAIFTGVTETFQSILVTFLWLVFSYFIHFSLINNIQYRFLLLFRILFLIFLLLMWTDPVKILTNVNIFCLFHSMFSYVSWYFFGLTKVFTYRDLF